MSSPTITRGRRVHHPNAVSLRGRARTIGKITGIVAAILVVAFFVLLGSRVWPFSQQSVTKDLSEASDSNVTVRSFHRTYFPSPGCVMEGIVFSHAGQPVPLITIEKLTVVGSYFGILRRYVPRIVAEGGHVVIPPFGGDFGLSAKHSTTEIGELIADGTTVDFAKSDPKQSPLRFDVEQGSLHHVRWDKPLQYVLKFRNPDPPGEISVSGQFGSWAEGGKTPITGDYAFEHADLGVYHGIAGLLASKGRFSGVLNHIQIEGDTDTPNFEVTSGGHKYGLSTHFKAHVDGTVGDTFLDQVDVKLGRTELVTHGSIAGTKDHPGKFTQLDFTSRQGRIEDLLGLFVTAPRSPMSGAINFRAKVELPPGEEAFLKRVKLRGQFGVDEGSFTKEDTQKSVNDLSAGARGQSKEDPETVMADLSGQVELLNGVANFSSIAFRVPGAAARMQGTYDILSHKINLHGKMRVDTSISNTSSGVKALLLKIMDPIFKKKKHGEIVPIHISGTYEHPEFGLDLGDSDKKRSDK